MTTPKTPPGGKAENISLNPAIVETFRAEAAELLDELEAALLELEQEPDDKDLVNRIFRALHTLKGSGKMCGFDVVSAFAHQLETAYDAVRSGTMAVTPRLVSLTLTSGDIFRRLMDGERMPEEEKEAILDQLREMQAGTPAPAAGVQALKEAPAAGPATAVYRVRVRPLPDIFRSGANLIPLFRELRSLGDCSVICHTGAVPDLAALDPEACHLSWDMVVTTTRGEDAIRDVFIFVEDECELSIEHIGEGGGGEDVAQPKLLGEILVEKGDVSRKEVQAALEKRPRIGEQLVEEQVVEKSRVTAALAEQRHVGRLAQEQRQTVAAGSVRVAADKLDMLVNLVGELVIVQARLSQFATSIRNAVGVGIAEEVARLTAELRDNTMGLRMLPIGTTFSKFKRVVRDLARELGKEVELVMEGSETELDKSVLEQLNDPLVHIIRNSVDHGIEMPEERQARGKSPEGVICLVARHAGASVVISITDDGAGLDTARIREKAVANGLIAADATLTDGELFQLIFEPGFSTAKAVSEVSGRGVGMDVVRRGVQNLRGVIDVTSSVGHGTAISIKLPLTLAIIDGLLVETAGEKFVIPQGQVLECLEQTAADIERAHGNAIIPVRGHMVPFICLRQRFGMEGDPPPARRVVLCEAEDHTIGLAVDRVIGSHQTVIKPLGEVYKNVACVSGATILGDGSVALIIDPVKLLEGALPQGQTVPL